MHADRAWLVLMGLLACRSSSRGDRSGGMDRDSGIVHSGGCSGTPQPLKGTCLFRLADEKEPMLCIEFTGSQYTVDSMLQACAAPSQYTTQPCPTSGLAGKCISFCGEPSESVGYIYRGTPDSVRRACVANRPPGYFVR
jgi:hypothetical protein